MLSGVKFIPRDQVQEKNLDASLKARDKSNSEKKKHRNKSKRSHYSSSSDGEELAKIKKGSRKKQKWYSSDESYSSETNSDHVKRRHKNRKKEIKSNDDLSWDGEKDKHRRSRKSTGLKERERKRQTEISEEDYSGDVKYEQITRKEVGLEWMVRPEEKTNKKARAPSEPPLDEHQAEEVRENNPRELNPYLKDSGSGYPEESGHLKTGANPLLSSSVVGDGGASWRLKALKRAQEQAAREGRNFEEVVEERWGSLGHLAVSVASRAAAPSRAHLRAIKNRKKNLMDECETVVNSPNKMNIEKGDGRDYLQDVSLKHPEMRAPKVHDSLSWGKKKGQKYSSGDSGIISAAVSTLNKFSNDGNFMHKFMNRNNVDSGGARGSSCTNPEGRVEAELVSGDLSKNGDNSLVDKPTLSANQLAAKVLQLRLKGRHEEADKLLKEAESIKMKQGAGDKSIVQQNEGGTSRFMRQQIPIQRKEEKNSDAHLGEWIMRNKQFSVTNQADDEYDFDEGSSRKSRKKGGNEHKLQDKSKLSKRILTQQERCQFCFESLNRPRHLVISIANSTYLMLPPRQPVVPGHCYILPLQHDSATRTVDDNVWEEIRNFKKCLIMMFGKEDKDVVFLETVMELAQQRRHCLIECVPLPRDVAKQAPLYFKKAIDEAEDEWSQHNAKRLIDTSEKGLRGSIPKDFPYFHVEFGLNRGYVHVIDDEKNFKKSFGLDVIRGMLRLPAEDMHRRGRHDSVEAQKQAVADFVHDWEPFDWTKQLG